MPPPWAANCPAAPGLRQLLLSHASGLRQKLSVGIASTHLVTYLITRQQPKLSWAPQLAPMWLHQGWQQQQAPAGYGGGGGYGGQQQGGPQRYGYGR